jgi:hypothetical protein
MQPTRRCELRSLLANVCRSTHQQSRRLQSSLSHDIRVIRLIRGSENHVARRRKIGNMRDFK